jgi:hypothetical protein
MTPEEKRFHSIGAALKGAESGKLFGKSCFKSQGKAFLCFFQNEMVFKLTGPAHAEALAIPGAQLFDPSGKGRPMKEWVQVPPAGSWEEFAMTAFKSAGG